MFDIEETARNPTTLRRLLWTLSWVTLAVSVASVILADHSRSWKQLQRTFHRRERDVLQAERLRAMADQQARSGKRMAAIDAGLQAAEESREAHAFEVRRLDREIDQRAAVVEGLDAEVRAETTALANSRSQYHALIDQGEDSKARDDLTSTIIPAQTRLRELLAKSEKALARLSDARSRREALIGNVSDLKAERSELTRETNRLTRAIEHLDTATYVRELTPPGLMKDRPFENVPRRDRCLTCHLGINRTDLTSEAHGHPLPGVFAAHPQFTGTSPEHPGRFLDQNGPHPVQNFGCTICHGGQGASIDLVRARHEPNDLFQKTVWQAEYGWREPPPGVEPMLPARFVEARCLACHRRVDELPRESKLRAGFLRFVSSGCQGCHAVDGPGLSAPELPVGRKVGPNLAHIGYKVSREWLGRWIKDPHAVRPETGMPRFYGLTNNRAPADEPYNDAEIHAMTHYLFAHSTPPPGFSNPLPVAGGRRVVGKNDVAPLDDLNVSRALDQLVILYVGQEGITLNGMHLAPESGKVESFVTGSLSREEKLSFLGEKTIARLGCAGCHTIPGFEKAGPVGGPLAGWGAVGLSRLDFGHLSAYLEAQGVDDTENCDGTDPYYRDQILRQTRLGFLFQKLHRPRSFDYGRIGDGLNAWDHRLRMPQYSWSDDPKTVEDVMTFVLGLRGATIPSDRLPKGQ